MEQSFDMFGEGINSYVYTGALDEESLKAAIRALLAPGSDFYYFDDTSVYVGCVSTLAIADLTLIEEPAS